MIRAATRKSLKRLLGLLGLLGLFGLLFGLFCVVLVVRVLQVISYLLTGFTQVQDPRAAALLKRIPFAKHDVNTYFNNTDTKLINPNTTSIF